MLRQAPKRPATPVRCAPAAVVASTAVAGPDTRVAVQVADRTASVPSQPPAATRKWLSTVFKRETAFEQPRALLSESFEGFMAASDAMWFGL